MEGLTDQDWRRLAETIQRGNCVLLLGPAVAVRERDPQRVALTVSLARALAEKAGPAAANINSDDFRHAAQVFLSSGGADRVDLELAVRDFFAPLAQETTDLHRRLAELPFSLCVNTTHDRFLANAFKAVGKTPQLGYYNFRKPSITTALNASPKNPLVFNLYGDLDDPDSLVLTENDLLDFLVGVIKNAPPLPSYVTARFSAPDTSFLFLGFGFQRWYVRILLHVLQAARHRYRSLALEDAGFFAHPDRAQTALFFEHEHLIGFKLLSWEDFVRELTARHSTLAVSAKTAASAAPATDAPLAFLCHVHEDREAVAALADRLQGLGIRVWLDRQSLRGGDDWDRLIQDVLGKHVNYVVVVQSPRMREQVRSYVYKEVQVALESQKSFARGIRFVIPVKLEPVDQLEELSRFHWIDLSAARGVEDLVQAIREDWALRQQAGAAATPAKAS